jgi:hypothetical protein
VAVVNAEQHLELFTLPGHLKSPSVHLGVQSFDGLVVVKAAL